MLPTYYNSSFKYSHDRNESEIPTLSSCFKRKKINNEHFENRFDSIHTHFSIFDSIKISKKKTSSFASPQCQIDLTAKKQILHQPLYFFL